MWRKIDARKKEKEMTTHANRLAIIALFWTDQVGTNSAYVPMKNLCRSDGSNEWRLPLQFKSFSQAPELPTRSQAEAIWFLRPEPHRQNHR